MREIVISEEESNQRADKFILKYLNQASKGFIYKMLRKKRIKLNHKRLSGHEILNANDALQFYLSEETINKFSQVMVKEVKITFSIIYEDEHILVCNKPIGVMSQPDGSDKPSLVDEVNTYLVQSKSYQPEITKGYRPGICNRLDRNTSGIILVGKHMKALQDLNQLIKARQIDKYYKAIVAGKIDQTKEMEAYLVKDKKRNKVQIYNTMVPDSSHIVNHFKRLAYNKGFSLVEIKLITGKTHQIRAHLAYEKHPILGDYKYGDRTINEPFKKNGLQYHLLHAYKIQFHEIDGLFSYLSKKTFYAPEPQLMHQIGLQLFEKEMMT